MRWFRSLGRRLGKSTPAAHTGAPPGEEDWHVGDLAECVFAGPWHTLFGPSRIGPALGEIRTVRGVKPSNVLVAGEPITMLIFTAHHGRFAASAFRKVTPRADAATRADEAFISSLTPAPAVPAVPQREDA